MIKNILVLGGTGLVGFGLQSISPDSKHCFYFASSKDADLKDYSSTLNLLQRTDLFPNNLTSDKVDVVIHLAAKVGGLFMNLNHNDLMFEDNLCINFNVIKACHLCNIQVCVSCLSTCIFPDKTSYPINEEMVHLGSPHQSNYGYSYAKRILDIHCQIYREKFQRDYFCIIPTNIYGPHDNFSLENGHVIPALIHKCYLSKINKQPFQVFGSGKPLRQFIYSEDLAQLILKSIDKVLENPKKQILDKIILSPPEEVSIKKIAYLIADAFQFKGEILFDTSKPDGQLKKTADNSKLLSWFPNFKFSKIEDTLPKTIDWFLENLENIRK